MAMMFSMEQKGSVLEYVRLALSSKCHGKKITQGHGLSDKQRANGIICQTFVFGLPLTDSLSS